jgi:hypothetical protein
VRRRLSIVKASQRLFSGHGSGRGFLAGFKCHFFPLRRIPASGAVAAGDFFKHFDHAGQKGVDGLIGTVLATGIFLTLIGRLTSRPCPNLTQLAGKPIA